MRTRVTAALEAVRLVAERPDPLEPVAVGWLAASLGLSLSGASRLCAELDDIGMLERAGGYGAYRLGSRAIRISGSAAAPTAQQVRLALTRASQHTGETVCLAARAGGSLRIVAAVVSAWTLYAPAEVGELVDGPGAMAQAAEQTSSSRARRTPTFESATGMRVEIAAPVRDAAGRTVAVVAVRLPSNRSRSGGARARRAVEAAQAHLEAALASSGPRPAPVASAPPGTALEAAARLLERLAARPDAIPRTARAIGVRAERAQRLADAGIAAGLLERDVEPGDLRIAWAVHGWHRSAAIPTLVQRADALVESTSRATRCCAFLTTLRGMRSVTLVEKLAEQPDGLAMTPWLGRPCPIVHADGGPTLLMDFDVDEIAPLISGHPVQSDVDELLARVRRVAELGVLSKESAEEGGQIAVSAPVRDASGLVVAAACIVGPSDLLRPRVRELEGAARRMAAEVAALLGYPGDPAGLDVVERSTNVQGSRSTSGSASGSANRRSSIPAAL